MKTWALARYIEHAKGDDYTEFHIDVLPRYVFVQEIPSVRPALFYSSSPRPIRENVRQTYAGRDGRPLDFELGD